MCFKVRIVATVVIMLISHQVLSSECSEEQAFKIGMEAISKKYLTFYKEKEPYRVVENLGKWVVLGNTPEGMRGGGAPEAVIDKTNCKLLYVSLAR